HGRLGGGLRGAVRRRRAVRRRGGHDPRGDAPVPGIRGRPAPHAAGAFAAVWLEEPVPVHGTAGRAGSDQLLRAPGVGIPGGGAGRSGVRPGVLAEASPGDRAVHTALRYATDLAASQTCPTACARFSIVGGYRTPTSLG